MTFIKNFGLVTSRGRYNEVCKEISTFLRSTSKINRLNFSMFASVEPSKNPWIIEYPCMNQIVPGKFKFDNIGHPDVEYENPDFRTFLFDCNEGLLKNNEYTHIFLENIKVDSDNRVHYVMGS